MATLCLLGIDGLLGKQWEISDQPVTVGRGASVDVKVEDDGLSRRHFMVLRDNDCILAGHTLFRFCEEHAPVSPALQPGAAAP
jgi:hypothetical protein